VLEIDGLHVSFPHGDVGWVQVLSDVSLSLRRGETLGLVGESGSGKTVTAMTAMGLLGAAGGRVTAGSVRLDGEELLSFGEAQWRRVRGRRIAMIFQQPTRALSPAFTVGAQIAECVRLHLGLSRSDAWKRAVEALDRVHIPNAVERAKDYPYAYSGGMCQRAMIAMALVGEPDVLIADEPTTALDVTVQARILDLLKEIQRDTHVGMLFITHDLGVIAQICHRVSVLYTGQVIEEARLGDLLERPTHPYTCGLLSSVPQPGQRRRLASIEGTIPDFAALPEGCRFHPRCGYAEAGRCDTGDIPMLAKDGSSVRCVRADELTLTGVPSGDAPTSQ
jgi:oligopeptide/dipeptide ABC transporter ATP-binding protein